MPFVLLRGIFGGRDGRGVRLIPTPNFLAKNQSAFSGSVEIFLSTLSSLSSIKEDKVWCPFRVLKWCLERTKPFRTCDQLFLESLTPRLRESLFCCLVQAIRAAGPGALVPGFESRAHDTRSISTSWALFSGCCFGRYLLGGFSGFAKFFHFFFRASSSSLVSRWSYAWVMPPSLVCWS